MKKLFTFRLLLPVIEGAQSKASDANAGESEPSGQIADSQLIGKWIGEFEVQAEKTSQKAAKQFELVFSKKGTNWNAVCGFNVNENHSSDTRDVIVTGERVSFQCNIENSESVFQGRLAEARLMGDIEIFEHKQRVANGTWSAARPKK